MAKSRGNRSGGNLGGKGGSQAGSKGKGSAGWPSTTGKPSGGGRNNAPKGKGK